MRRSPPAAETVLAHSPGVTSAAEPLVVLEHVRRADADSLADPKLEAGGERVPAVFVPDLVDEIVHAPATPWLTGERAWWIQELDLWHAELEIQREVSAEIDADLGRALGTKPNALIDDAVDEVGRQLLEASFRICERAEIDWSKHSSEPNADPYAPRDEYRTLVDGRMQTWSARAFPLEAQLVDENETRFGDPTASVIRYRPLRREAVLAIEDLARKRLYSAH